MDEAKISDEENWTGYSTAEHRTTGGRAWCHACGEWCYSHAPCGERRCLDAVYAALDRAVLGNGTSVPRGVLAAIQPATPGGRQ